MQPADAPAKPRVSGFSTARLNEITQLTPDLVIIFSDVQAHLAAELIKRGLPVLATNQRTLEEIETTLAMLGESLIEKHKPNICSLNFVKSRLPGIIRRSVTDANGRSSL
jgi:iron complex transport system substrate-binding protein